jgi:hypothetical protein
MYLILKKLPKENNRQLGEKFAKSGKDVMVLKIFSPKIFAKKFASLLHILLIFVKFAP